MCTGAISISAVLVSVYFGYFLNKAFYLFTSYKYTGRMASDMAFQHWLKDNVGISDSYTRKLRKMAKDFYGYKKLRQLGIPFEEFYKHRLMKTVSVTQYTKRKITSIKCFKLTINDICLCPGNPDFEDVMERSMSFAKAEICHQTVTYKGTNVDRTIRHYSCLMWVDNEKGTMCSEGTRMETRRDKIGDDQH